MPSLVDCMHSSGCLLKSVVQQALCGVDFVDGCASVFLFSMPLRVCVRVQGFAECANVCVCRHVLMNFWLVEVVLICMWQTPLNMYYSYGLRHLPESFCWKFLRRESAFRG